MGYSKTLTAGDNFTFYGRSIPSIAVTTTPTDFDLYDVVIPNWGEIVHAYVEVIINRLRDSSGALQTLSGRQYIIMKMSTEALWNYCINLEGDTLRCDPSVVNPGAVLGGTYDVADFVTPGNLNVRLQNFVSRANNLYLHDTFAKVQVVFR